MAIRNGGPGADSLTGTTGADRLSGNDGADRLYGGRGADSLFGGAGNDTLYGGGGNDFFDDGPNNDTMYGGDGVDSLFRDYTGASGFTLSIDFVTGAITAVEFPGDPDFFFGIENYGFRGTLNSVMTGNDRANEIRSDGGRDTLYGGGEDDRLFAGAGNDTLFGGSGADRLDGGRGNDVMAGGTGADIFVFDAALGARNADSIFFYSLRADSIEIESDLVGRLREGVLARSAFVANESGTATAASHRFVYETDTGKLYFDADGKGGAARALVAELSPNLAMTHSELTII